MAKIKTVLARRLSVIDSSGGKAFRFTKEDSDFLQIPRGLKPFVEVVRDNGKLRCVITAEWPVEEK